jgi:hypothetical protein
MDHGRDQRSRILLGSWLQGIPSCREFASAKKNQEQVAITGEPVVISSNKDIVDSSDDFFENYISEASARCTLSAMAYK